MPFQSVVRRVARRLEPEHPCGRVSVGTRLYSCPFCVALEYLIVSMLMFPAHSDFEPQEKNA